MLPTIMLFLSEGRMAKNSKNFKTYDNRDDYKFIRLLLLTSNREKFGVKICCRIKYLQMTNNNTGNNQWQEMNTLPAG